MTPSEDYLDQCGGLIAAVWTQLPQVRRAADWFSETIAKGRMVHVFASGHSRIMVEEMWPRYGSFPGFNPIVELSLTFHNLVVGANGQRQAMFLENVSGLAERILRNFDLSPADAALVISSSGCNVVPVEMAELFQKRGLKTVAIISRRHSEASTSNDARGKKLQDFADLTLDTGAPPGDAMVTIDGLDTPVSPGSTVGGCLLVNAIKAEVAQRLTAAGHPPKVLSGSAVVGAARAKELFEAAYDEHGRRLARLYANLGATGEPVQIGRRRGRMNPMLDVTTLFERMIAPDRGDLSAEHARHVLRQEFTAEERARCEVLSYKAQDGTLTPDEARKLDMFLAANAFLTALKAKARRSLDAQPSAA